MDWLVSSRKDSRPGLSLPLGTSSAELGREARKQEVARGDLGRAWGDVAFSVGNCWEYFSTTRVPSRWLTPWFLFPPPLSSFLLQPCLCPSIQLPESAPSWRSRGGLSVPSCPMQRPALAGASSQQESSSWATLLGAVLSGQTASK